MQDNKSKKIRIFKIAAEYNLSAEILVDFLVKKGFDVKTHMSILNDEMITAIQDHFNKDIEKSEKHYKKIDDFNEKRKKTKEEENKRLSEKMPYKRIKDLQLSDSTQLLQFAKIVKIPVAILAKFYQQNEFVIQSYFQYLDAAMLNFIKNDFSIFNIFLEQERDAKSHTNNSVLWGFLKKSSYQPPFSIKYLRFSTNSNSVQPKNIKLTDDVSSKLLDYFSGGEYIITIFDRQDISNPCKSLELIPSFYYSDYLEQLESVGGTMINDYSFNISTENDLLSFAKILNEPITNFFNNKNKFIFIPEPVPIPDPKIVKKVEPGPSIIEEVPPHEKTPPEKNTTQDPPTKKVPLYPVPPNAAPPISSEDHTKDVKFNNPKIEKTDDMINKTATETKELEKKIDELAGKLKSLKENIRSTENSADEFAINFGIECEEIDKQKDKLSNDIEQMIKYKIEIEEFIQSLETSFKMPGSQIMWQLSSTSASNSSANLSFKPKIEIENSFDEGVLNALQKINDNFKSLEDSYTSKFNQAEFEKDLTGYKYHPSILRHIDVAVESDRLTILSGQPGFGKSKLIESYIKFKNKLLITDKNLIPYTNAFIPVKPEWIDPSYILGSMNYLTNEPEITDFVKILYLAEKFPNIKFFVFFDEFNIARPENYFAPFLSIRELDAKSQDRSLKIWSKNLLDNKNTEGKNEDFKIKVGNNLYFLATINEDASTVELSPKVLDRSDLIIMDPNEEQFNKYIKWKFGDPERDPLAKLIHNLSESWWSAKYNVPPFSYRSLESLKKSYEDDKAKNKVADLDALIAFRLFNNLPHQNKKEKLEAFKDNVAKKLKTDYPLTLNILECYYAKLDF